MRRMPAAALVAGALLLTAASPAGSDDLPFPLASTLGGRAHPRVVDVTDPPFNAVGDDRTDNSQHTSSPPLLVVFRCFLTDRL